MTTLSLRNVILFVMLVKLVTSGGTSPISAVTSWWNTWRNFLTYEWDPAPLDVPIASRHSDVIRFCAADILRSVGPKIFEDRDDIRNVHFYLFSDPENPNFMEEIHLDDPNPQFLPNWNASAPTKIMVHGFIQNINATFPQNLKNAYLKRSKLTSQNYNIIVVDWGSLAYQIQDGLPLYTRAVRNVEPVGTRLGQLILYLRTLHLLTPSSLHLIGQSLGAHVIGQAGYWLKQQSEPFIVSRITGLDPAGPLFYSGRIGRLLQTEDAKFVDVVHCNPGGLGVAVTPSSELGTAEFFVNWNPLTHLQPQCTSPIHILQEKEGWHLCSHNYCPKFFAWSVLNKLEAKKCNGLLKVRPSKCEDHMALFGEDVSLNERGKFFIDIKENLDDMKLFLP